MTRFDPNDDDCEDVAKLRALLGGFIAEACARLPGCNAQAVEPLLDDVLDWCIRKAEDKRRKARSDAADLARFGELMRAWQAQQEMPARAPEQTEADRG